MSDTPINLGTLISSSSSPEVPHYSIHVLGSGSGSLQRKTHFLNMLRRIFSFELSSDLSETYASGLEIVGASVVESVDVAVGDVDDGLALLADESREGMVVIIAEEQMIYCCPQSNTGCRRRIESYAFAGTNRTPSNLSYG